MREAREVEGGGLLFAGLSLLSFGFSVLSMSLSWSLYSVSVSSSSISSFPSSSTSSSSSFSLPLTLVASSCPMSSLRLTFDPCVSGIGCASCEEEKPSSDGVGMYEVEVDVGVSGVEETVDGDTGMYVLLGFRNCDMVDCFVGCLGLSTDACLFMALSLFLYWLFDADVLELVELELVVADEDEDEDVFGAEVVGVVVGVGVDDVVDWVSVVVVFVGVGVGVGSFVVLPVLLLVGGVSISFLTILAKCISNALRGVCVSLPSLWCMSWYSDCACVVCGCSSGTSFAPMHVNPDIALGGMSVSVRLLNEIVGGRLASGSTCIASASVPRSVQTQRAVLRLKPSMASCSSIV